MSNFGLGRPDRMTFRVCARGYVLDVDRSQGMFGETFAFDDVESLSQWLIDHYAENGGEGPAVRWGGGKVRDALTGEIVK